MAPTSSRQPAVAAPKWNALSPSNSSPTASSSDEEVETCVWPWQAPEQLAKGQRTNVFFAAGALFATLVVVLVGSFALVLTLGHGHKEAAPSVTLAPSAPAAASTTGPVAGNATNSTGGEAAAPSLEASTTGAPSTAVATTSGAVATTSGAVATTSLRGSVKCYNFYSSMNVNALQAHPNNPDSAVFGFATCILCNNGTARCTSLLHSGKSELIASHIHLAQGANVDGSTGEGPPVINFCGSSAKGLIDDGAEYSAPCKQWKDGAAHNSDVGILIPNFNKGITFAQRVEDIVNRPNMYFFNFHSLASWNHWYPTPKGMARGVMVFQGVAV